MSDSFGGKIAAHKRDPVISLLLLKPVPMKKVTLGVAVIFSIAIFYQYVIEEFKLPGHFSEIHVKTISDRVYLSTPNVIEIKPDWSKYDSLSASGSDHEQFNAP